LRQLVTEERSERIREITSSRPAATAVTKNPETDPANRDQRAKQFPLNSDRFRKHKGWQSRINIIKHDEISQYC
jgi:hypothetical protein